MDTKVFKRSEILGALKSKGFVITDRMLSCICDMVQEAGGTIVDNAEMIVDNDNTKTLPFDTIDNASICNFPVYTNTTSGVAFVPSVYFDGLTRTESSRSVNTLVRTLTEITSTLPIYWEENDNLMGIGMVNDIDVRMGDNGRRVIINGQVRLNNNPVVQRLIADKRIEQYSDMFGIEPSLMAVLMVNENICSTITVHGIIVKAKTIHDYFLPDPSIKDISTDLVRKPLINYQVGLFIKNPFAIEWDKVESLIDKAILLKQDKFTVNKDLDISIRSNYNYGNAIPTVGGYLCLLEYLGQVKPKFTIKSKYIFVSME